MPKSGFTSPPCSCSLGDSPDFDATYTIKIRTLSFFNRDWFNSIQNKDSAAFWSLLFGVFCFWAAIAVLSSLVEYYTESVLKIRWRRWMTERYYGLWLDDGSLYRAALLGQAADNPDQRIAEDIHNFLNSTYAYSISLLSTVSTLVSFSIILWTIQPISPYREPTLPSPDCRFGSLWSIRSLVLG